MSEEHRHEHKKVCVVQWKFQGEVTRREVVDIRLSKQSGATRRVPENLLPDAMTISVDPFIRVDSILYLLKKPTIHSEDLVLPPSDYRRDGFGQFVENGNPQPAWVTRVEWHYKDIETTVVLGGQLPDFLLDTKGSAEEESELTIFCSQVPPIPAKGNVEVLEQPRGISKLQIATYGSLGFFATVGLIQVVATLASQ